MSKGKIVVQFSIIFIALFLFAGSTEATSNMQTHQEMYAVLVNNTQIGVVKYAARGLAVYDSVVDEINNQYEESVFLQGEILFQITDEKTVSTEEELAKAIKDAIEIKTMGQGLVINGKTIGYLKTKTEVDALLEIIQAPYKQVIASLNNSLQAIDFKEEWKIIEEPVDFSTIITVEQALEIVQPSISGMTQYTVKDGDTIWDIAKENDMSADTLQEMNPGLDIEAIQPGERINLKKELSLLTVVSKETTTYTDQLDFDTKTIENAEMYKGETKVKQKGEKGEKEIQALITRENGKVISKEIISEKVLIEAVDQIEEKGTKTRPVAPISTQTTATGAASDIIAFAKQQLGKPYSSSNNHGPNSFDCSGFTSYVYRQFGINISSSSRAQAGVGTPVNRSNLQPGDLLLFTSPNSGGAVGHVGIYLGGGNFIHATSGSRYCVAINALSGNYDRRYKGARRLLN